MIIPTTESTLRMTLMQLSETKLELTAVTEQRDGLRSGIDYASDQLTRVTEQRDDFKKELEIANLRLKGKRHPDDNGIMADDEIDVKAITEQRDRLAEALNKYRGQVDNEGNHSAPEAIQSLNQNVKVHTPLPATASDETGVKP